jgi:hypothetical protein
MFSRGSVRGVYDCSLGKTTRQLRNDSLDGFIAYARLLEHPTHGFRATLSIKLSQHVHCLISV